MKFRLLKHHSILGVQLHSGTMIQGSILDKELDDGRIVYHHPERNTYEILPAELVKVVYDSADEMELELAGKKAKEAVRKERKIRP